MAIKLSKSIEILDLNIKEVDKRMPLDVRDSLILLLTLARAVQFVRKGGSWDFHALLPDEKPDEQ